MTNLKKTFGTLLLLPLALAACNDDANDGYSYNPQEVRFNSVVETATRAAGTSWNANDAVGVYMIKTGTQLSQANIVGGAANKKYVTLQGDGVFQGYNTDETIYYPEDGSKVDFISYYPCREGVSGYSLPIDVSDQSNQAKIDLLYTNNGKALNMDATAQLTYKHKLTRLVFNIKSIDGNENLSGLSVKLGGFKTQATFSLVDGSISINSTSKAAISTKVSNVAGGGAVAEAIVLPEEQVSGAKVTFNLPQAGDFDYDLKDLTLSGSTQITFTVNLTNAGGDNKVVVLGSQITGWTEQDGGDIDVDFGDGGGTTDPDPDPTPDPDPDPNPNPNPVTQTIFSENFGESVEKGSDNFWPGVDAYTGWQNQNLTFSDPSQGSNAYSNASVRQTSTLPNPHIWFAANKLSNLKIEGFNTTGYTNLKLTYDIAANAEGNQTAIKVLCGTQEITVPSVAVPGTNKFQSVTLTGMTAGFTSITFVSEAGANTAGYRVDNVKLVGDK